MKKIVFLIMCLCSVYANSQEGIPFFVNYPASVYQAHNRNFDVVCDSCGNVYFVPLCVLYKTSYKINSYG